MTGVQTCALPISRRPPPPSADTRDSQPEAVTILQCCDRAKHTANQTACEKVATIPSQKLKSRDESDEGSEKEAATEAYPLLERVWWFHGAICRLTVKLRGRATTPDERRGRILPSRARGAKQITPHGPLQRLLERFTTTSALPLA